MGTSSAISILHLVRCYFALYLCKTIFSLGSYPNLKNLNYFRNPCLVTILKIHKYLSDACKAKKICVLKELCNEKADPKSRLFHMYILGTFINNYRKTTRNTPILSSQLILKALEVV